MSQWGNKDYANNVPKFLTNNHPGNTNVYLVSDSRLANATFGSGKAVAHKGWVKINQGTGFVKELSVSNVNSNLTYANGYITFVGANTTPANARVYVTGGNNVTIILNNGGAGYNSAPTATSTVANSNNSTLVFTVTPGGRMGRVQSETIVALSDTTITDANSGLPYFTGS